MLFKNDKRVQNGLQQNIFDYQSRGFKVVPAFGDGVFELLAKWVQDDLHVDLTICAADSQVPRGKNTIRFVKERLRAIQCEIPFRNYPKRLTIEMVKWVTVLINHSGENKECIQWCHQGKYCSVRNSRLHYARLVN